MAESEHLVVGLIAIATIIVISCAIILWLLPRRWIAKNESAANVLPKGAPVSWGFSNSFGKIVWICLYLTVALYLLAAFIEYS